MLGINRTPHAELLQVDVGKSVIVATHRHSKAAFPLTKYLVNLGKRVSIFWRALAVMRQSDADISGIRTSRKRSVMNAEFGLVIAH